MFLQILVTKSSWGPRPSFKYTDPPPTCEETFCNTQKREVGRLSELTDTDYYKLIEITRTAVLRQRLHSKRSDNRQEWKEFHTFHCQFY